MAITNFLAVALCFVILLLCIVVLLACFYLSKISRYYADETMRHHQQINEAIGKYLSALIKPDKK